MSQAPIFHIVMAGGRGTRFWPKSTSSQPKQLLSFGKDSQSLLQKTIQRFEGWIPRDHVWIVTTKLLEASVKKQLGSQVKILAEPEGRNTAPCLYWAARELSRLHPDSLMVVTPADHYIQNPSSFLKTVQDAANWAQVHSDLVTLGIRPTRPETGYGYLKLGEKKESAWKVKRFVEKPDLKKAQEFLESGEYLWNGGLFVWRTKTLLEAFDRFLPQYQEIWEKTSGNVKEAYPLMQATSIDFGIMEKAENVMTFPLGGGWDDLGSWTSLENLADHLGIQTSDGVVVSGNLIAQGSHGHIVDVPGKYVTILGDQDLIVVETENTLLILPKSKAQDLKTLVEKVQTQNPELI